MKPQTRAALKHELLAALCWGALMLVVALAAKCAQARGYIDGNGALRIMALNGLWIAYYGNHIPKRIAPHASARALKVQRFTGWTLVLTGLVYAALWAFAPIPAAGVYSTAAVGVGVALTLIHSAIVCRRPGAQA